MSIVQQAGLAAENERLCAELQARTAELEAARRQQAATAEVLRVINRSGFDLASVLQTLIKSATELSGASQGTLWIRKGDAYFAEAFCNPVAEFLELVSGKPFEAAPEAGSGEGLGPGKVVNIANLLDPMLAAEHGATRYRLDLSVPLLRDGRVGGVFAFGRIEPGPFAERQIELAKKFADQAIGVPLLRDRRVEGVFVLGQPRQGYFIESQVELVQTFADQALIAIENARLFEEVQAKTRDLGEALRQQTATADVLKVISRAAFDLNSVLTTLIGSAIELCDATFGVVWLLEGGALVLAAHVNCPQELLRQVQDMAVTPSADAITASGLAAFTGDVVNVADMQSDPRFRSLAVLGTGVYRGALAVPLERDGKVFGTLSLSRQEARPFSDRQIELVKTFADQAVIAVENVRLFRQVEARTQELARSLDDLRATQDRLIQTEKLASLGQLTAGIAHEIKNPLNFINNFADLGRDLMAELNELLADARAALGETRSAEIAELTQMITGNLDKVVQHGRRADSIVKNMLLHSRQGGGERRSVDLNAIVEESLNLAYHGARAERKGFNITLAKDLDTAVGAIDLYPQEFTRVLLNLFSNGFYAAHRKKLDGGGAAFSPTLAVSTKALPGGVEIRVRDNGTGIEDAVKAKMFNPFFTTKPAGEGTGLGLSLSHDIVVKQHGGTIDVDTRQGEYTEFVITLPRDGQPAGGEA